jgi:hypothetical protein
MAQLQTQTITITLSRLVKNGDDADASVLPTEVLESLEAVVGELAGDGVMVEIE